MLIGLAPSHNRSGHSSAGLPPQKAAGHLANARAESEHRVVPPMPGKNTQKLCNRDKIDRAKSTIYIYIYIYVYAQIFTYSGNQAKPQICSLWLFCNLALTGPLTTNLFELVLWKCSHGPWDILGFSVGRGLRPCCYH